MYRSICCAASIQILIGAKDVEIRLCSLHIRLAWQYRYPFPPFSVHVTARARDTGGLGWIMFVRGRWGKP